MASKANGKGHGGGKAAAPKKAAKADAPKADRRKNVGISKAAAREFAEEYNRLLDEKETLAGEAMSDVKNLIERASNQTGMPRAIMRQALQDQRQEKKRHAKEKEMEPEERQQLKSVRDALGVFINTPLGQSAAQRDDAGERPSEVDDAG